MDTRDYKPSASTIVDLVNARAALQRAFESTSALLGLSTNNDTIVPGKVASTASALADAQRDAENAANLLRAMGVVHPAASETGAA